MSHPNKNDRKFSVQPYLRERFDRVERKLTFRAKSISEWEEWRKKTCQKLRDLTGYSSMTPAPLNPNITEEVDCSDYLRQRIEIQTEPKVIMPFYALVPKNVHPPYKVVLCPHGHGGGGKVAVAGIRDNPEVAQAIKNYNYDYGIQFVKAGLVSLCPDARGFGERQEEASQGDTLASSCQWINQMAYPLGQTVTGMWTWDLHRLLDYVSTRSDFDHDRVGCAGLSGGGLQTLWATALDERIKCAVVSGYFYGYKESLLDMHTNCSCNYVPHLYEHVDMGDIAALIAPRPLLIETGTKDTLNGASGLANVKSQVEIARRAYRLLGADEALKHDIFEGEHRWNGVEAIPWIQHYW